MKITITLLGIFGIYFLSYVSVKLTKPENINSNDGPHAIYNSAFAPLRYLDSNKPDYYSSSREDSLEVKIQWMNLGNGYLYFEWEGKEYRAALAGDISGFSDGDIVDLRIEYDLLTYDDFSNNLIPYIVEIQGV